jgi:hypothetical protein
LILTMTRCKLASLHLALVRATYIHLFLQNIRISIRCTLTPSQQFKVIAMSTKSHALQWISKIYLVSPILIVLLNIDFNLRYRVTNTKCLLNIICHSLKLLGEIINFLCCNSYHLPKFQSSITIFHYTLLTREGRVLTNE